MGLRNYFISKTKATRSPPVSSREDYSKVTTASMVMSLVLNLSFGTEDGIKTLI